MVETIVFWFYIKEWFPEYKKFLDLYTTELLTNVSNVIGLLVEEVRVS